MVQIWKRTKTEGIENSEKVIIYLFGNHGEPVSGIVMIMYPEKLK